MAAEGEPLVVDWACDYRGAARDLVRALKFGRRITAAAAIAERMEPLMGSARVIVPVPASPRRRRWRGFDPAEEIALALGRLTGLEVRACLRRADGARQVGRSRAERLANPPRVRAVDTPIGPATLVDDVFTTGATLSACARALDGSITGAVAFARAGDMGRLALRRSIE
jgi:predicted amidophosphoribosyltransferase